MKTLLALTFAAVATIQPLQPDTSTQFSGDATELGIKVGMTGAEAIELLR
jgi:uncharacterized protein YunC (DUF1805 family)